MVRISAAWLRRVVNFWPPLLFAGISVRRADEKFRELEVQLKLRWWNRNSNGTQFGGSLFSMTDPFYALMIQYNLGAGYVVWDKAAQIDYVAPGHGTVRARFVLTQERIAEVLAATADGEKCLPAFDVEILDRAGGVVARVRRVVYVRRKLGIVGSDGQTGRGQA